MLTLKIDKTEFFDEATMLFVEIAPQTLVLEHSLISVSKWEAKWKKPFLDKADKTSEELIDYIRCMTVNSVDPRVYAALGYKEIETINDYINDPMTATWFSNHGHPTGGGGSVLTSELIYYKMVEAGVPFECQKWHLNRLLVLLRICAIKAKPPKKMSKKAALSRQAALNAARRKQAGSSG